MRLSKLVAFGYLTIKVGRRRAGNVFPHVFLAQYWRYSYNVAVILLRRRSTNASKGLNVCQAGPYKHQPVITPSNSSSGLLQGALPSVKMSNAVASYDQLAHQVEALRKENSHLRRELEDNSHHLSKLETETTGMKVSLDAASMTSQGLLL